MEGPGPGAAAGVGAVDVVVGGGAPVLRFGAACAGAASVAPTNERTVAEARTPIARMRVARRLLIAPTRPHAQIQDAVPKGAELQVDPTQLHRQGPPQMRAARSQAPQDSDHRWRFRCIRVSAVLQLTRFSRRLGRRRVWAAVDQDDANTRRPATQVSDTAGGRSGSSVPSSTTRSAWRPGLSCPRSFSWPPALAASTV